MSDFHTYTVTGLSRLLADKQASATTIGWRALVMAAMSAPVSKPCELNLAVKP